MCRDYVKVVSAFFKSESLLRGAVIWYIRKGDVDCAIWRIRYVESKTEKAERGA